MFLPTSAVSRPCAPASAGSDMPGMRSMVSPTRQGLRPFMRSEIGATRNLLQTGGK